MRKCLSSVFVAVLAVIPCVLRAQHHSKAQSTVSAPVSKSSSGAPVTVIPASVWQMADEERIAKRTTAAAMNDHHDSEKIDGSRTPELFLRYELYDFLLWGMSDDETRKQAARAKYDPKIRSFGYDVDRFWRTLEIAAGPYIELKRTRDKQHQHTTMLALPNGKRVLIPMNRDVCGARIAALEQTRETLGKGNFDRFLYTVVAPSMTHTSSSNTALDVAAQLRYMAGGCK